MTGYTRQSTANILAGEPLQAQPIADEFNALEAAFHAATGHVHDGTTGDGPKISLTAAVSGTLPTANGGTNITTYTTGDIIYASALNTLSKLSIGSTGQVLTITAGVPAWSTVEIGDVFLADDQTLTGLNTLSMGTSTTAEDYLRFQPTNYATSHPRLYVKKESTATKWSVGLTDGTTSTGTINLVSSILTWNDVQLVDLSTAQTLTTKTFTNPTVTNYTETAYTFNTSTAATISLSNGTVQIATLTGNCTYTFPTAAAGKSFFLIQKQDGTGSRTATWPAAVKWPFSVTPTLTSTASKADIFAFTSDGTYWYGRTVGQTYL